MASMVKLDKQKRFFAEIVRFSFGKFEVDYFGRDMEFRTDVANFILYFLKLCILVSKVVTRMTTNLGSRIIAYQVGPLDVHTCLGIFIFRILLCRGAITVANGGSLHKRVHGCRCGVVENNDCVLRHTGVIPAIFIVK